LLTPANFFPASFQPATATEARICEIRAAFLGSAAQERAKSVNKVNVKRMLAKKLAGISGYIDLVCRQMNDMSPQEAAVQLVARPANLP
jgi:hypothetical protein